MGYAQRGTYAHDNDIDRKQCRKHNRCRRRRAFECSYVHREQPKLVADTNDDHQYLFGDGAFYNAATCIQH